MKSTARKQRQEENLAAEEREKIRHQRKELSNCKENVGKKCNKNPEISRITHVRQHPLLKTGWQKPKP